MPDKRDRIIAKIKKCFELAGGAGTEAEAQSALNHAQRLMAEYSIERVDVDGFSLDDDWGEWRFHEAKSRPLAAFAVARVVMEVFPVKIMEGRVQTSAFTYARTYDMFGSKADVEMASYAFHYLIRTFKKEYARYREWAKKDQGYTPKRPEMRAYYDGLASGMIHKVRQDLREASVNSTALVRINKEMDEQYRKRYGGQVKKARTKRVSNWVAQSAGFSDGQKISLRQGIKKGSGTQKGALNG